LLETNCIAIDLDVVGEALDPEAQVSSASRDLSKRGDRDLAVVL